MRRKLVQHGDVWAVIGLFVLVCIIFARFLFATDYTIYNHDISYFYPHETVIRHSLAQDEFPLWNPYFGAGSPQLGKIQVGMFYPPTVLLRSLLPIIMMFNWEVILHVYLAGLGMYFLLRDLGVKSHISVICAVAFMLSGAIMPRVFVGHASIVRVVIWISWLLWAYRRLLQKNSWGNLLLTVFFLTLVILGGHPQLSVIVLIVPLSYFLLVYLPDQLREKNFGAAWKSFSYSALAVFLAVAVLAIQIIPFAEWLGQTTRGQGESIRSFEFMTSNSLNLEHLLTLIFPYLLFDPDVQENLNISGPSRFWEASPFISTTLLILLIISFILTTNKKKKLSYYLIGLAFFGLVMSMGKLNPLYRLLFYELPIFRGPGRFVILWVFSTVVLAGLYANDLPELLSSTTQRPGLRKAAYLVTFLFILSLAALGGWAIFGESIVPTLIPIVEEGKGNLISGRIQSSLFTFTITLTLITLLIWLAQEKKVNIVRWQWLAFFVLLAEMLLFIVPVVKRYPTSHLYRPDHLFAQLEIGASTMRVDGFRVPPNYLTPTLDVALNGEEQFTLTSLVATKPQGLYLLSAGNLISDEPINDPDIVLIQQKGSAYLYEYVGNLPRVYLAPAVKVIETYEEAFTAVTDPTFAPFSQAFVTILESDKPADDGVRLPSETAEPSVFTAEYLDYRMNSLTAQVTTERPGIVVFSEMYYPGWEATVDDQPTTIWLTNYAFRGVVVDEGTHIIRMDFKPQDFQIGLTITVFTLLIILLVTAAKGIVYFKKRRKHDRP